MATAASKVGTKNQGHECNVMGRKSVSPRNQLGVALTTLGNAKCPFCMGAPGTRAVADQCGHRELGMAMKWEDRAGARCVGAAGAAHGDWAVCLGGT